MTKLLLARISGTEIGFGAGNSGIGANVGHGLRFHYSEGLRCIRSLSNIDWSVLTVDAEVIMPGCPTRNVSGSERVDGNFLRTPL